MGPPIVVVLGLKLHVHVLNIYYPIASIKPRVIFSFGQEATPRKFIMIQYNMQYIYNI